MAKLSNVNTRRLLIGTGVALATNLAVYGIASTSGATWEAGLPFPISLLMVAAATIVPMLLGGLVVRLLSKNKPSLITWAAWLGLAFAVATAPSGLIAAKDISTGLALSSMHIVVGLAWFFSIKSKKD
jgi:hypothetical protein